MKHQTNKHHLYTNLSGDPIHVTSFHFQKNESIKFYFQANIHGPEIFGSILLFELIEYLKNHELDASFTIVPQANPIGVSTQIYGMNIGRWNQDTGNDWNRIFSKQKNGSIEFSLSDTLLNLAKDHDVVLDIHTSGCETISHIYTQAEFEMFFSHLNPKLFIHYDQSDYYGAFDETCFLRANEKNKHPLCATWEVATHSVVSKELLTLRFSELVNFIQKIINHEKGRKIESTKMKLTKWLHAPQSGYLIWVINSGEKVKKGECFAHLYSLEKKIKKELLADFDFQLITKGHFQAIIQGNQFAKVAHLNSDSFV